MSASSRSTSSICCTGARLLAEHGTDRKIAGKVGCSARSIANYRKGAKPRQRIRAKFATALGIPESSWDPPGSYEQAIVEFTRSLVKAHLGFQKRVQRLQHAVPAPVESAS